MKHSDILVAGSGMAGLMAAITAAKSGVSVSILSQGAGVLSIGGGAVDFLGYIGGKRIKDDPFNHLEELDKTHPYNIIGENNIKAAFDELISVSCRNGYAIDKSKDGLNRLAVSILGTVKPTYICSESNNASRLLEAEKILFVGVEHLKDNQPELAAKQIKRYKMFEKAEISAAYIKSPFGKTYRALNCLDIARYVDKEEGRLWLKSELMNIAGGFDALVIPPICGVYEYASVYADICSLGAGIIEMLSIPPGVGGFRLREALVKEAKNLNVKFMENCSVQRAVTDNKNCKSFIALHSDIAGAIETEYSADRFIIATGGIMGGGLNISYDEARESIFKIPLKAPDSVERRSERDVFANHAFAKFGVAVSPDLKAVDDNGETLYDNVFFAGNTLGGYDFPAEKSGYGVAAATGFAAAMAALRK